MSPILLLTVGYLLVLGAIVLVCFLGDPRSQSPLGQATYFFTVYLPVTAEHVLKKVPGGGALVGCVSKSYDYACNKPNPLLQIVYLLLVLGGFLAFQIEAMPFIPNKYLGEIHLYTSHIAVLTTLATFLLASNSNPGVVTSRSLRMHDSFPYDGFLYVKRDCSTCKIRKVARSKHCSICNVCVSKFDHHCPWINTCVGEANYRVFLTFLLCTASLLFYAMYGLSLILIDYVEEKKLFSRQFKHMETGQIVPASYSIVFTYLFLQKATLIMLLVLCTVMGVVVFLFFLYHLYLISQNTTTNESSKWGSVKGFYKNIAKRGAVPDRSPEEEKELVNPDTAPSLEGRAEDQFPAVKPANIYNKGIFANFAEVFFPPCFTSAVAPPSTTSSSALKSSNASKKKKSKRN